MPNIFPRHIQNALPLSGQCLICTDQEKTINLQH